MPLTDRPKSSKSHPSHHTAVDRAIPEASNVSPSAGPMAILEKVRVKVRASLDHEEELQEVRDWLERWKPTLSLCQRSGGVWDERYEVVLPRRALDDISSVLIKDVSAE